MCIMLAAIVLFEIAILGFVKSETNCSQEIQSKIIGKRLTIDRPRVERNIGFHMCLRKCEAMSYCLSINFNRVLLDCELNYRRKTDINELVDDELYFYAETNRIDHFGNVCGQEICNNYSSCITLSGNRNVCIETDCSESAPVIPYGKIVERTYIIPASITYECNPDCISNGSYRTITCHPGGRWSTLDFHCEKRWLIQICPTKDEWKSTETDPDFSLADADVVCRSLGYSGALQVCSNLEFGSGSGEIWMDEVDCFQDERKILDCDHITAHDCSHDEDVGVICEH